MFLLLAKQLCHGIATGLLLKAVGLYYLLLYRVGNNLYIGLMTA